VNPIAASQTSKAPRYDQTQGVEYKRRMEEFKEFKEQWGIGELK
jgi:hypothetical protein